jgi:TonB family protein
VIDRYKKTPSLIIDRELMVLADLDADGAVQQLATLQTSGDAALDSAVEKLIQAAAPFGQLPSAVQTVQVELTVSPLQKKPK